MKAEIKFEYGFESVNGIVKKVYHLNQIPHIQHKCDVWKLLRTKYVRQFIGLKDKNGVEIFEGDILQSDHLKFNWPFRIYQVEGGFVMKASIWSRNLGDIIGSDYLILQSLADEQTAAWMEESCSVIGNIYQNPELLK